MFRTTLYKIKKSWTHALPSRHLRFCSKNSRCTPAGTQKLPTCVLLKEKSTDVTRDGNRNCVCGHCLGQHSHCNCDKCLRTLGRALRSHYIYKNCCCKCTRGHRRQNLQNSNQRQIDERHYGEMQEDNINVACKESVAFIKIDEIVDKDTQTKVDNMKQVYSAKQCQMNASYCNTNNSPQGTTPKHLDAWTNKINKIKETRNSDVYLNFNKNIHKDTGSDLDELAMRCLDSPHCEIDQRLLKEMSSENIAKDKLRSKCKVDAVQSSETVQAKKPKDVKETQLYNEDRKNALYVVKDTLKISKYKSCAKNIAKHENVNKRCKNLHQSGVTNMKKGETEACNTMSKPIIELCDNTSILNRNSRLTHHAYYKKPAVLNFNKYYIKDNANKNETLTKERDVTCGERIQSCNKDGKAKVETKLNQNSHYTYYRKPTAYYFKEYYVKVHNNINVSKREVREKTNAELSLACTVNSEAEIETFHDTSTLKPNSYYTYYKKPEVSNFKDYYLKGNACKNKTINETKEETKTRDIGEVTNDSLSNLNCIPTGYQNSLKVIPSEVENTMNEEKLQPPVRAVCLSPDLVTVNENTKDVKKLGKSKNKHNVVDNVITEAVTVNVVKPLKVDFLSTSNSENSNGGELGALTLKSSKATKPLSELLQKVRKQNRMTYGKEVITNGRKFCYEKQRLSKNELNETVGSYQPQCPPPAPKPCPPPKPICPPPPPSCPPPPPPPPCPPPTCPPPPCPPPPVCPPPKPPRSPPPPCPTKNPCKRICPTLSNPHMFNEDKWIPKSKKGLLKCH